MKILLLILLMAGMSAGAANRKSLIASCELNLSPTANVLSRLIKMGLDRNDLQPADVRRFLELTAWTNPYDLVARSERTLSFKSSFATASRFATEVDKVQVKDAVASLLASAAQKAESTDHARAQTEQILAPRVLRHFRIPNFFDQDQPFHLGWYRDRPIFLGRMTNSKAQGTLKQHVVVLDPFHPNGRGAHTVMNRPGSEVSEIGFALFVKDGAAHAIDLSQRFVFDLDKSVEVVRSKFQPTADNEWDYFSSSVLVNLPSKVKQIGIILSKSKYFQMWEVDPFAPEAKPRILVRRMELFKRYPLRLDIVNERNYVTFTSINKLFVYDANAGEMVKRIPVNSALEGGALPLVYGDEGHARIAYMSMTAKLESYFLNLVDLKSGNHIKLNYKFDEPTKMDTVVLDGVPHMYVLDGLKLLLVNLRTLTVDETGVDDATLVNRFTWNGREHLIWCNESHQIKIYDLNNRYMVYSGRRLNDRYWDLAPVVFRGHVYALAVNNSGAPQLLQITHGGGEQP